MKLQNIKIQGFRSFNNPIELDFCQLTMLIGNNNIGKSSVIDILEIALSSNGKPDEKDYYICKTGEISEKSEKIKVILNFQIGLEEENALQFALNNIITYKVVYTNNNSTKEYLTRMPKEEELRCDFSKLSAPEQKDILRKYAPEALETTSNSTNRCKWFDNFIASGELIEDWKEAPNNFMKLLPRIQRYSAMDYTMPEKLIDQTVRQVFESVLFEQVSEEEQGEKKLRKSLQDIEKEAEEKINEKVAELKSYIIKYAPMITNISYEPQIDFSRGFQSGVFKVDEGGGDHYLDRSGDGTKRKIFIATTDWDREVTLAMQSESGSLPNIIRAYDEPDTNLDYQAQRQLFRSIFDIVNGENSNIQAIICTHSPRMIDRAPAQNIRMLKESKGQTIVEKLNIDNDIEVELFLTELAKELGITNSLIFYENCFILVEGETEFNALPLFYRTIYGHSLLEDGINIITVKGKSAFKEFLRLLSRNKQELVIFLMDTDCETSRDDKMTKQVLKEYGFPDSFCEDRVLLVGNQEFEDLFSKEILVIIYNKKWPKIEGSWKIEDFSAFNTSKKYSDELGRIVRENCNHQGEKWSKPELGNALGKNCDEKEIPEEIKTLFKLARDIAKVE